MARRQWLELTAWTLGVALGSLYVGVRLRSNHERAEGIEEFRTARAAAVAASAPALQPAVVHATVDRSLWSTQRVAAFAASLSSAEAPKGVLGMVYGGFTYTKDTHEANVGPLGISIKDKETVNVPIWAGVVSVVIGGGLLFLASKKS